MTLRLEAEAEFLARPLVDIAYFYRRQRGFDDVGGEVHHSRRHAQHRLGVTMFVAALQLFAGSDQRFKHFAGADQAAFARPGRLCGERTAAPRRRRLAGRRRGSRGGVVRGRPERLDDSRGRECISEWRPRLRASSPTLRSIPNVSEASRSCPPRLRDCRAPRRRQTGAGIVQEPANASAPRNQRLQIHPPRFAPQVRRHQEGIRRLANLRFTVVRVRQEFLPCRVLVELPFQSIGHRMRHVMDGDRRAALAEQRAAPTQVRALIGEQLARRDAGRFRQLFQLPADRLPAGMVHPLQRPHRQVLASQRKRSVRVGRQRGGPIALPYRQPNTHHDKALPVAGLNRVVENPHPIVRRFFRTRQLMKPQPQQPRLSSVGRGKRPPGQHRRDDLQSPGRGAIADGRRRHLRIQKHHPQTVRMPGRAAVEGVGKLIPRTRGFGEPAFLGHQAPLRVRKPVVPLRQLSPASVGGSSPRPAAGSVRV